MTCVLSMCQCRTLTSDNRIVRDHRAGRDRVQNLGQSQSFSETIGQASRCRRLHTGYRNRTETCCAEGYIPARCLYSYSRALDSLHKSRRLDLSWVPYRQDLFRFQKALVSPPFLVPLCRCLYCLREYRPYRPNLPSDPMSLRIPATRSSPTLFRSLGPFPGDPFRQSSALVFSLFSVTR